MENKTTYPEYYTYPEEPCHHILASKTEPQLAFSKETDYAAWRNDVKNEFIKLSGLDRIEACGNCDPDMRIEYKKEKDGYTEYRLTYQSEENYRVPSYLLIPNTGRESYPVAITLQGHSTGFHNSVGEIRYKSDIEYQPRGGFGVQSVRHGYATLCIEQRGMGERRPRADEDSVYHSCNYTAMQALILGRTILGERVWDIHRGIDLLEQFFLECDTDKIVITGNSGGGTTSYYAACYDERIKLCAPSCAFCPYPESIIAMSHCTCNYLPGALCSFDMQDLACLIAPRKLSVIAGSMDAIFPIDGVKRGFETAKAIYEAAGAEKNCTLTVTPRNHWWCEDIVWGEIDRVAHELHWK